MQFPPSVILSSNDADKDALLCNFISAKKIKRGGKIAKNEEATANVQITVLILFFFLLTMSTYPWVCRHELHSSLGDLLSLWDNERGASLVWTLPHLSQLQATWFAVDLTVVLRSLPLRLLSATGLESVCMWFLLSKGISSLPFTQPPPSRTWFPHEPASLWPGLMD